MHLLPPLADVHEILILPGREAIQESVTVIPLFNPAL